MKQKTQKPLKMHVLQPKHIRLSDKDAEELLKKLNISKSQLPKIFLTDPALPEGCEIGDIIKIERTNSVYYRVVV